MNVKDNDQIINLGELFSTWKKNIWKILIFGILSFVLFYLVTVFFITPKYSSTVDILVSQKSNEDSQTEYTQQQANLQAIKTYKDILEKDVILKPVLKQVQTKNNYAGSLAALKDSVTVANEESSQIISVKATDSNSYIAADIANTVGKVFTEKIKKMMNVNNVIVVTKAVASSRPISPDKRLISIIGFLVGIFLGIVFYGVKGYTDKTIKSSSFITDELHLTNLGKIYHVKSDKDFQVVRAIDDKLESSQSNSIKRV